jgi:hypothetical protein
LVSAVDAIFLSPTEPCDETGFDRAGVDSSKLEAHGPATNRPESHWFERFRRHIAEPQKAEEGR